MCVCADGHCTLETINIVCIMCVRACARVRACICMYVCMYVCYMKRFTFFIRFYIGGW